MLVASGAEDRLVRLPARGTGFGKEATQDLTLDLGPTTQLTAVGERAVLLDPETGDLLVPDGGSAALPPGSVLQQPGPPPTRCSSRPGASCSRSTWIPVTRLPRRGSQWPADRPGPARRVRVRRLVGRPGCRRHGLRRRAAARLHRSARTPPTSCSASTAARSSSTTGPAVRCGTSTPTRRPASTTGRPSAPTSPRRTTSRSRRTRTRATVSRPRPSPTSSAPAQGARRSCTRWTTTPRPRAGSSRSGRWVRCPGRDALDRSRRPDRPGAAACRRRRRPRPSTTSSTTAARTSPTRPR